jgi:hypothetical protein
MPFSPSCVNKNFQNVAAQGGSGTCLHQCSRVNFCSADSCGVQQVLDPDHIHDHKKVMFIHPVTQQHAKVGLPFLVIHPACIKSHLHDQSLF